jgi:hypothetical protein
MDTPLPLTQRSFEELLWQVLARREQGLAVLRDRDGLRHGAWVQAGFVVGVHVAGRFDPLLDLLRQGGVLSDASYRGCVDALWRGGARAGALAVELAGVERAAVRDALKAQAAARLQALLVIAESRGHDAGFEPGPIPASETSVRMPLGSLLRGAHASSAAPAPELAHGPTRVDARRKLRELARSLHPDRHAHLDAAERQRLERQMAAATAAYHGFA